MNKSEQINELALALSKFQTNVKQPLKDANNPFFRSKYVPLENVAESVTESAGPLGLSYMQWAINEDDKVGVSTIVMHSSGQYIEFDPIFAKPAKQDPQAVGSTITYLKRYSLSAAFGITSDEDNDAEGAMNRGNQQNNSNYNNSSNYQKGSQQQSKSQQSGATSNATSKPKSQSKPNLTIPKTAKEAQLLVIPDLFDKHKGKTLGKVWIEDKPYLASMMTHAGTPIAIVEGILLMQQAAAEAAAKTKGE